RRDVVGIAAVSLGRTGTRRRRSRRSRSRLVLLGTGRSLALAFFFLTLLAFSLGRSELLTQTRQIGWTLRRRGRCNARLLGLGHHRLGRRLRRRRRCWLRRRLWFRGRRGLGLRCGLRRRRTRLRHRRD